MPIPIGRPVLKLLKIDSVIGRHHASGISHNVNAFITVPMIRKTFITIMRVLLSSKLLN